MLKELEGSNNYEINSPLDCGGYFIWVKLRDNVNLEKLRAQLVEDNIVVGWGEIFVQEKDRELEKFQYLKRRMRLGFSFLDEDVLVSGCKKIRAAIDNNSN
jgi:DNA-binding transcriptional MocR family regulator